MAKLSELCIITTRLLIYRSAESNFSVQINIKLTFQVKEIQNTKTVLDKVSKLPMSSVDIAGIKKVPKQKTNILLGRPRKLSPAVEYKIV